MSYRINRISQSVIDRLSITRKSKVCEDKLKARTRTYSNALVKQLHHVNNG